MNLELQPVDYDEACLFIAQWHRHHIPPQGWKFGIAINAPGYAPGYADQRIIVGVITVGRPVARHLDTGLVLEVTRCCTIGHKNANSMLYGAAWRAAKALGYKRLITYTLKRESGASLIAAGWHCVGNAGGGTWDRPNRARIDKAPIEQKLLWDVL